MVRPPKRPKLAGTQTVSIIFSLFTFVNRHLPKDIKPPNMRDIGALTILSVASVGFKDISTVLVFTAGSKPNRQLRQFCASSKAVFFCKYGSINLSLD